MSETNDTDAVLGEIHVIVRPPRDFEIHTSYDTEQLYYTLGQLQHMIMMGGLKATDPDE